MCKASDDNTHIWRNRGAVAQSGFGDGFYKMFVARGENGSEMITGVKIVFIDDEARANWEKLLSRSSSPKDYTPLSKPRSTFSGMQSKRNVRFLKTG